MTDLLPALAERLLVVLKRHWTHPEMMADGVVQELHEDADVCAREALAFVAERLLTREETLELLLRAFPKVHTRQSYESSARTCWATERGGEEGRCHEDEWPDHWTHDQRANEGLSLVADVLLRDVRERLGVKS